MSSLSSWPFSEVLFTALQIWRSDEVMKKSTSCAGIWHKDPVWDPVNQQKLEDLIVRWSTFWGSYSWWFRNPKKYLGCKQPVINSGRNYQHRYKKHPKTEIPKTTQIHRRQMNARWNAFVSSSDGSPENMDGPCELVRSTVSCHGLGIRSNLIRLKEWYDIRRFWQMLFFPFFFQVQFLFHFILRFLRYEITRVPSTSIGLMGWHFSIQGGVNLPRDSRGARGGPRGRKTGEGC